MTTQRRTPTLERLLPEPGKRPYVLKVPGIRGRVFLSIEEMQALADLLNDELDNLVQ